MLESFENVIAAIVSDGDARSRFARDRAVLLDGLDLDPREKEALLALPREAVDRYARSLLGKRWGEVARVVPLTLRICPNLGDRYRRWAATHPAPVVDTILPPGPAEALRALPGLSNELRADASQAAYVVDLLSFEVLSACARADGIPRNMRASYRLEEIVDDLRRGLIPIDPEPSATEFVFEAERTRWHRR